MSASLLRVVAIVQPLATLKQTTGVRGTPMPDFQDLVHFSSTIAAASTHRYRTVQRSDGRIPDLDALPIDGINSVRGFRADLAYGLHLVRPAFVSAEHRSWQDHGIHVQIATTP
jgi:hypothetical protein